MLPTLRQRYEQTSRLDETLDTQELQKMAELLDGLGQLIEPYELPELKSGLEKATDDLTKSIGGKWARIKAGSSGEVKASPSKLAKVASFQTAFIKGLKQLPEIQKIIKQLRNEPKDAEEALAKEAEDNQREPVKLNIEAPLNPAFGLRTPQPKTNVKTHDTGTKQKAKEDPKVDPKELTKDLEVPKPGSPKPKEEKPKTVRDELSDKAYERLKGIMLNAFSPPGFLAMFRGMPYVKDPTVVDDLLNLSQEKLDALTAAAGKIHLQIPADKADFNDIVRAVKDQGDGDVPSKIVVKQAPTASKPVSKESPASKEKLAQVGKKKDVPAAGEPGESKVVVSAKSLKDKLKRTYSDDDENKAEEIIKYLSAALKFK